MEFNESDQMAIDRYSDDVTFDPSKPCCTNCRFCHLVHEKIHPYPDHPEIFFTNGYCKRNPPQPVRMDDPTCDGNIEIEWQFPRVGYNTLCYQFEVIPK